MLHPIATGQYRVLPVIKTLVLVCATLLVVPHMRKGGMLKVVYLHTYIHIYKFVFVPLLVFSRGERGDWGSGREDMIVFKEMRPLFVF